MLNNPVTFLKRNWGLYPKVFIKAFWDKLDLWSDLKRL